MSDNDSQNFNLPTRTRWQRFAAVLANSPIFCGTRRLAERNHADWNLPVSRVQNLMISAYMILADFASGSFPRDYSDQARAYANEMQYGHALGGVSKEEFAAHEMRKPFWDAGAADRYLNGFVRLLRLFESCNIRPGNRVLELGCGSGWMAELFALTGYHIVATTIAPSDLPAVERRAAALAAKQVSGTLNFRLCPMESIDKSVEPCCFDAAFVHQALHHAYDWKAALHSAFRTLKAGGWMIIADEPNIWHTFSSYRMGKLSNTHEVGMSKRAIVDCLRDVQFREIRSISPRFNDRIHPHWIIARK